MKSSVDYPLNLNPAYQKSPSIRQMSVIGTASYGDDSGRYPVIIEYEINENRNEVTIHEHRCPPAEYDALLEDIYSAVYEDLIAHGYYHTYVNTYKA